MGHPKLSFFFPHLVGNYLSDTITVKVLENSLRNTNSPFYILYCDSSVPCTTFGIFLVSLHYKIMPLPCFLVTHFHFIHAVLQYVGALPGVSSTICDSGK